MSEKDRKLFRKTVIEKPCNLKFDFLANLPCLRYLKQIGRAKSYVMIKHILITNMCSMQGCSGVGTRSHTFLH